MSMSMSMSMSYYHHLLLFVIFIVVHDVCAELDEANTVQGTREPSWDWRAGKAKPTEAEAAECQAWLNGTHGTYNHPKMLKAGIQARSGGFTSQNRQDKVLFENLFRHLNRPGIYADVAANHYKRISNTYFYDRCLNWRGICVEPNPVYRSELREKRTCHLVPTCVSNATSAKDFHMSDNAVNGVYGSIDLPVGPVHRLHCVTLGSVFADLGITHIDFMSLDVELHEAAVLSGIDFTRVQIDYIVCETSSPQCAHMLPRLGYHRVKLLHSVAGDDYWTRGR